jgi:hypothetical protein
MDYNTDVNLGEPVKIGTVEKKIPRSFLDRIVNKHGTPVEEISSRLSHETRISKKQNSTNAGSKLNKRISSKKNNRHVKKTYKKKMYKI